MEEKNLTDAQLGDVEGGATTTTETVYLCPECGGQCRMTSKAYTYFYMCKSCHKRLEDYEVIRRELAVTIDGNFHTVSGEF